ncbi:hypothetical protein [Micromonospora sp. 067-2]
MAAIRAALRQAKAVSIENVQAAGLLSFDGAQRLGSALGVAYAPIFR